MWEVLLAAALALWCLLGAHLFWSSRGAALLTPESAGSAAPAPSVSILVPARDEAAALPALLGSLFALDYPNYEIILVDDNSADGTGRLAAEWAQRPEAHGRPRVLHNRELPPGWSGKVHALHLAARAGQGEWLLATDADVVFHPRALRLAMGLALERRAALLSLTPDFEYGTFWEKVVLPAFALLLLALFPLRRVNDPRSPRAIAAGAFILMRAEDFRALGGYESIASVVIEDLRMAELFKRGGRRILVAPSRRLIRTRMYKDAREMFEGLSRSAFEGTGFSLPKVLGGLLVGLWTAVFPWAAALDQFARDLLTGRPLAHDPALLLALAAMAAGTFIYFPVTRFLRVPPLYVFALPLAAVFYCAVSVNSAWRSVAGSGVPWKGRRYRPPR
jgi:chlorobactene glucosyltransferase